MIFSFPPAQQVFFLITALTILFLPGLAWIAWTYHSGRDWIERIADALALSIAAISVFGMVFFVAGWSFSWVLILIFYASCLLLVLAAFFKKQLRIRKNDLLLLACLFLALAGVILWRFYQARTLALPAWVDSVHHVLVVQKILDARGIPLTLAPELPIHFSYHYGFHIVTALWSAVSGLGATDAVLWLGQVLNALMVLGIYRLAKQIWKDMRIAVLAAVLVAFVFYMPAYYLTWGRYTLITGLLCMLPAMAAGKEMLQYHFRWEIFWRLVLLTAGLALVHYMALLFLGLFVGCLLLVNLFGWLRRRGQAGAAKVWARALILCGASLAGLVISAPWLYRLMVIHSNSTGVQLMVPDWEGFQNSLNYIVYLLGPGYNYWLLGMSAAGLLYAWLQKQRRGFVLWSTLMSVLSIPWGLKIGPFRPDHFAIVLFIPAAILLANGLVNLCAWAFARFGPRIPQAAMALAGLFLLVFGAWQTRNILNPVTIIADQADRQALEWIARYTPADARFYANTTVWQYATYRGVDGGYWITPMTRRFSTAMPSLYPYGEAATLESWRRWIRDASQIETCGAAFQALLREANLDYVYLREHKGSLQPQAMENCSGWVPVYILDGVWIFHSQR